jgi:quinol monooxygenase YgiN
MTDASSNGPVTVIWEARAKAGKDAAVRDLVARIVTPSRNDPGNVDYEAHEVEGRPGTFVVYERWASREALQNHAQAPWIPELIPALEELLEGSIEDELRFLRVLRPTG